MTTPSIQIVIAEDSATQAAQLQSILESKGYAVSATSNGCAALARIRAAPPALVVTDVIMPEMDGFELCGKIKTDPGLNHIPVILVTTLTLATDILKGLAAGADNFITKPYDPEYLLGRVQYVLNKPRPPPDADMGLVLQVEFGGETYSIGASRAQIVELLLTSYETAMSKNFELEEANRKLREAAQTIKTLGNLVPICASCKKIRRDKDYWQNVEGFIQEQTSARMSHGICPDCMKTIYPEFADNPPEEKPSA